ncbi:MAG: pyridoxamine 5'-phosphate oxidase family protein [Verrucomicrobiota bacterium]|nr:pyridoxamine 5'-phosphate oxidase family protein [Verrucomicrobiota bacterium]
MFIKELERSECFEILTEKSFGRLACARENQPYVVPFHFDYDGQTSLYAFSRLGQKIEWMRANPLVCVEADDIKNQFKWTSLVIFGRYEELPETSEFEAARNRAHELLSRHAMWWQPGFVAGVHHRQETDDKPIYFRIHIKTISGHRAASDESLSQPV